MTEHPILGLSADWRPMGPAQVTEMVDPKYARVRHLGETCPVCEAAITAACRKHLADFGGAAYSWPCPEHVIGRPIVSLVASEGPEDAGCRVSLWMLARDDGREGPYSPRVFLCDAECFGDPPVWKADYFSPADRLRALAAEVRDWQIEHGRGDPPEDIHPALRPLIAEMPAPCVPAANEARAGSSAAPAAKKQAKAEGEQHD